MHKTQETPYSNTNPDRYMKQKNTCPRVNTGAEEIPLDNSPHFLDITS